ncbi:MAG: hypothetical protein ACRD5H_18135 [Nitrososphaerales archaeon]
MKVDFERYKSDDKRRRGGGSRYGKRSEVEDLIVEENKFCGCWLCRWLGAAS